MNEHFVELPRAMPILRFCIRALMITVAVAAIAASAAFVPRPCRAQTNELRVPRDLKIVASYDAGFSASPGWTTTITGDGKAVQIIGAGREAKKNTPRALTESELRDLVRKLKAADYFRLGPFIGHLTPDLPHRTLTITAGDRTHEVHLYPPTQRPGGDSVERFFIVWDEVLRKCPEPKRD